MSWEMTSAVHWPEHLVEGEFPNRGSQAADAVRRLQELLNEGWEPFTVLAPSPEASVVWLKRFVP